MDETTRDALEELVAKAHDDPRIVAVLQYGSSVQEGRQARDMDVCLVLDPTRDLDGERFLEYFGLASGQRHEGLDVSVFQRLPVYVRHRVLEDAKPLQVDDEEKLYRVALETGREYERFRPFHQQYLESVARG